MKNYLFLFVFSFFHLSYSSFWSTIFSDSYAQSSYEGGDFLKAHEEYDQLLDQNSYGDQENYNMGNVLYRQSRFDEAKECFERAATFTKYYSLKEKAYFNAGNCLLQLKKYNEAKELFDKVLDINSENESAKNNRKAAEILEKIKEQKKQDGGKSGDDEESEDGDGKSSEKSKDGQKESSLDKDGDQSKDDAKGSGEQCDPDSADDKNSAENQNQNGKNQDSNENNRSSNQGQDNSSNSSLQENRGDDKNDTKSDEQRNHTESSKKQDYEKLNNENDSKNDTAGKDYSIKDNYKKTSPEPKLSDNFDEEERKIWDYLNKIEDENQKMMLRNKTLKKGNIKYGQKNW